MPEIAVTPDVSSRTVEGEVAAKCAVCPHPWTFHDRIAARFCTATVVGNFSRGCVCTAYPDGAAPHDQDKDTR